MHASAFKNKGKQRTKARQQNDKTGKGRNPADGQLGGILSESGNLFSYFGFRQSYLLFNQVLELIPQVAD